ncbi:hypothetical protein F4818DRAFT_129013 [Hypoxylon cercidicola]|nr:hypothetical protein F4818DRAFT_129013 [Hypoxylon cercidicola]
MADEHLLHKIHGLGDLDLAALLCLVGREHCIISTEPGELDALTEELRLVASQTFNLQSAVVDCTPHTTLDDLVAGIQLPSPSPSPPTPRPPPPPPSQSLSPSAATPRSSASASPLRRRGTESSLSYSHPRHGSSHAAYAPTPQPRIANVILARNLDRAPADVQIQCLELLRTRRILTRTSVQTAPKQFLFVAVLEASGGGASGTGTGTGTALVSHLNNFFYVSHWHDPEDGFVHLEEEEEEDDEGQGGINRYARDGAETASLDSASSVVRRSIVEMPSPRTDRGRSIYATKSGEVTDDSSSSISPASISISESDIASLALLARQVSIDVEVLRYQMNIVSFLRMHRAVAPGGGSATPLATKHFTQLAKCLAAVHGLDYVTPSLVGLAANKIYPHRLQIVTPKRERSVQWGSDIAAVETLLEGIGPELVIEDVLAEVAAPL